MVLHVRELIEPTADLKARLKARYTAPGRSYHGWGHVEGMLDLFERFARQWHRPSAVLWAIYWHDAIYDAARRDNEDRSADLLLAEAGGKLPEPDLHFAETLIRATADHEVPEGLTQTERADAALFLDLDLAPLAVSYQQFLLNSADIRGEYGHLSDEDWITARHGFFCGLLAREHIYSSQTGRELWEAKARANLRRALAEESR